MSWKLLVSFFLFSWAGYWSNGIKIWSSSLTYNTVDVSLHVCCVWKVLSCESNLSPHGEVSRHSAPGSRHLRGQHEVLSAQQGEHLQENLIRQCQHDYWANPWLTIINRQERHPKGLELDNTLAFHMNILPGTQSLYVGNLTFDWERFVMDITVIIPISFP